MITEVYVDQVMEEVNPDIMALEKNATTMEEDPIATTM